MNPTPATQLLRLGTRGSRLALVQVHVAAERIASIGPGWNTEVHTFGTRGDRDRETALPEIGGRGAFTEELEQALLGGEIDAAVHALKDLPIQPTRGVITVAVCCREDPRDALVSRDSIALGDLPAGSVVGTSSTRRAAQLRALRPDLVVRPIRGNVDTRLKKVQRGEYRAAIVAAAGLVRLGLGSRSVRYMPLDRFLPAPGQGALALQCRASDGRVRTLLERVDDPGVRACTDAERAFLAGLGAGCSLPVAALATLGDGVVRLRGWVGATDGSRELRVEGHSAAADAEALGRDLARGALRAGAGELLA